MNKNTNVSSCPAILSMSINHLIVTQIAGCLPSWSYVSDKQITLNVNFTCEMKLLRSLKCFCKLGISKCKIEKFLLVVL